MGTTGSVEECDLPIIPDCIDKTTYCSHPPTVPNGAEKEFIHQPNSNFDNTPSTMLTYSCTELGFAFDYSVDSAAKSFAFAHNIFKLTMVCTESGFWNVSDKVEDETCINQQGDGTCQSVNIPGCVDRGVYCEKLTAPNKAILEFIEGPNPSNTAMVDTKLRVSCLGENHYFDYSTPSNLISYHYSKNINNITLKCSHYG